MNKKRMLEILAEEIELIHEKNVKHLKSTNSVDFLVKKNVLSLQMLVGLYSDISRAGISEPGGYNTYFEDTGE